MNINFKTNQFFIMINENMYYFLSKTRNIPSAKKNKKIFFNIN